MQEKTWWMGEIIRGGFAILWSFVMCFADLPMIPMHRWMTQWELNCFLIVAFLTGCTQIVSAYQGYDLLRRISAISAFTIPFTMMMGFIQNIPLNQMTIESLYFFWAVSNLPVALGKPIR